MKKITLSQLLIIILSVSLQAQNADFGHVEIEQYTLNNGLTVILSEDHTKPEVFGYIVCKAGSKNDPANATGMAHYQEHLLFKGTQELATRDWEKEKVYIDEIIKLYEKLGQTLDETERLAIQEEINQASIEAAKYAIPGEFDVLERSMGSTNLNANTDMDRTVYHSQFPANQIEKWLELNSHRFGDPVFRGFQSELEVVYEERNKLSDQFFVVMIVKYFEHFFKTHPYGQQNTIGEVEHLKNPPLKEMIEFYNTYYVANNMALILTGDFNTDDIKPMIEEKFGKWRTGILPEYPDYEVKDFIGRELVKERLSPVRVGLMGFRTMPATSSDKISFLLADKILSNQNQTGLFDKLKLENKLMEAQLFSWGRNDYGQSIVLFLPKIVGQSFNSAENLIKNELQKLRNGEFDDWTVEAQKKAMYKDWTMDFEDITQRAILIGEAFQQGNPVDELLHYPDKINALTKEDIVRVANKYYGDNYLLLQSRIGFRKPDHIKQPTFEPIDAETNIKSDYRKRFDSIQSTELDTKYIDFELDINKSSIKDGVDLYYDKNPKNDIFTLKIRFGVGNDKLPLLKYASDLYNYAGTQEYTVNELKNEFSQLACSYSIYSNDSYLTIDIEGLDDDFETVVKLINKLLNETAIAENKFNIIYGSEKQSRKKEKAEPDKIASALVDYVKFGDLSKYIDRPSLKELKKLETNDLITVFEEATTYSVEIFYTGTINESEVVNTLQKELGFTDNITVGTSPVYKQAIEYTENTVFFVDKKNARQSKVYFLINGTPFSIDDDADINAFNQYFGSAFTGLVFQEIRTYRSLAYTTTANYATPNTVGKESAFVGYLGTQASKTLEAIKVYNDLIQNMPEKSDRIDFTRQYLELSTLSKGPGFRDFSETVLAWEKQGFTSDPAKMNIPKYKELEFEDIVNFYKENIKDKPMAIVVVGNKKEFDYNKLSEFGKLKILEEESLFEK